MKTEQLTFSIENISKKDAIIVKIYLVQQMKYIPEIGKVCKLHMKKTHFRKNQKTHYRIRKIKIRQKMIKLVVYFSNMKAISKIKGTCNELTSCVLNKKGFRQRL